MGLVFCSMIALVALCKYFIVAASTSGPETRGNVSCRKPRSRKKHKGRGKSAPRTKVKRGPPLQRAKHAEYGAFRKTFYPFREIGGTVGSALVGSLFTSNLASQLTANLAQVGGVEALGVDANALMPNMVLRPPRLR